MYIYIYMCVCVCVCVCVYRWSRCVYMDLDLLFFIPIDAPVRVGLRPYLPR